MKTSPLGKLLSECAKEWLAQRALERHDLPTVRQYRTTVIKRRPWYKRILFWR